LRFVTRAGKAVLRGDQDVAVTSQRINEYANSMFRFERLNDAWIDSCVHYLEEVFGDAIAGATVVDYAFGRGNWSLAFLRAGAAKVVAVEASEDMVRRFSDYCRDHDVQDVEIIHGDVLAQPLDVSADIIWLYGILHHVPDADSFLDGICRLGRPDSLFLIYAYKAPSLRQFVVESVREVLTYPTADAFLADSYLFARAARLRARNDLSAPHPAWYTASALRELLARHDLRPVSAARDFQEFVRGRPPEEFRPHHWLCRLGGEPVELADHPEPTQDLAVLRDFVRVGWDRLADSPEQQKKAGIGLFNSHFSAVPADNGSGPVLVEDFLYLAYLLLSLDVPPDQLEGPTRALYELAIAALSGDQGDQVPAGLEESHIAQHVLRNRIRL